MVWDVRCLYVGCGPVLCGIPLPPAFVLEVLGFIISSFLLSVDVDAYVEPLLLLGVLLYSVCAVWSVIGVATPTAASAAVAALFVIAYVSVLLLPSLELVLMLLWTYVLPSLSHASLCRFPLGAVRGDLRSTPPLQVFC